MTLINPKLAATACLFTLLTAPAVVLADDNREKGKDRDKGKHSYAVPEPRTLTMTLVGMGLRIGLVFVGVRPNRRRTIAA